MHSIRKLFGLLRMVVGLSAIAVLSLTVVVTESQADETIVLNVDVDEASFAQVVLGDGAGRHLCGYFR